MTVTSISVPIQKVNSYLIATRGQAYWTWRGMDEPADLVGVVNQSNLGFVKALSRAS